MRIVVYYRVSTRKQKQSGLGLDAQRAAVEAFVRANNATILAEFKEVESGTKSTVRPQLQKAIEEAKRLKATLVIAKLDRLKRNVYFIAGLLESGVDFICCDNPHATKFTIQIMAVIAEHESECISARTRAALAAAKRKGIKLGSARPGHWKGREHLRRKGLTKATKAAAEKNHADAQIAYREIIPLIHSHRAQGMSLRQIADTLNAAGHITRRGKPWNQTQVMRVLGRKPENGVCAVWG